MAHTEPRPDLFAGAEDLDGLVPADDAEALLAALHAQCEFALGERAVKVADVRAALSNLLEWYGGLKEEIEVRGDDQAAYWEDDDS